MLIKFRLIFAIAACLLLSNCGLIDMALRLAPYYLLLAEENGQGASSNKAMKMRGQEVQEKGSRGIPHSPAAGSSGAQVAFKR
jgi:hypothetical protein